jgi:S-methylmethionine-dependent homocysteine/selenocysteine methylase
MSKYRNHLPQLHSDLFLTDGGLETTLIFHDGIDLPEFAAFSLVGTPEGDEALSRYCHHYIDIAKRDGIGIVLETPTWRASEDWGAKLGYTPVDLADINRGSVADLEDIRKAEETDRTPIVISGNIGPRGDGYNPGEIMTINEARAYHSFQIKTFSETSADMVTALTMTNVEEAAGITLAAQDHDMPVVIAFTVETDGKLPSGDTLKQAIEAVDLATDNRPAYYMINCAHPTHFQSTLATNESWIMRLRGIRANASCLSHAELDEAEELDAGNPVELGHQIAELRKRHPQISVLGGCCGTDHRHIAEIARSCKTA